MRDSGLLHGFVGMVDLPQRSSLTASHVVLSVDAFEYSVAQFSKKLMCSMAFSIWSIHGSGLFGVAAAG
jgi:hypothetical protein